MAAAFFLPAAFIAVLPAALLATVIDFNTYFGVFDFLTVVFTWLSLRNRLHIASQQNARYVRIPHRNSGGHPTAGPNLKRLGIADGFAVFLTNTVTLKISVENLARGRRTQRLAPPSPHS